MTDIEKQTFEQVTELLKQYFSMKSLDGKPERQELRKKIKELLDNTKS